MNPERFKREVNFNFQVLESKSPQSNHEDGFDGVITLERANLISTVALTPNSKQDPGIPFDPAATRAQPKAPCSFVVSIAGDPPPTVHFLISKRFVRVSLRSLCFERFSYLE